VKRLRGFKKIDLKIGESKTVVFNIDADDIAFVGIENQWITEPGVFGIQIKDLRSNFEYKTKN
jgi:beta-glucosidase